jgi:hypothetical protein
MSRDHHNDGQEDSSNGKYDPPHSSITDLIGDIIGGESDQEREDRESYDAGHHNTSSQKGK